MWIIYMNNFKIIHYLNWSLIFGIEGNKPPWIGLSKARESIMSSEVVHRHKNMECIELHSPGLCYEILSITNHQ